MDQPDLEVSQGEPVTTAQKRPNEIEVESNKKLKVDPEHLGEELMCTRHLWGE